MRDDSVPVEGAVSDLRGDPSLVFPVATTVRGRSDSRTS